ncbi:hypothetical protein [Croceicoccus bisphenolivorans]|uniref:hypothetical protein n=1 Tax=Croceicoccus bisphenolivorans TaxID=1783232 RepID=UPI0008325162|nr:hypothetical protein [Croceicoccus bisphenolivorans]
MVDHAQAFVDGREAAPVAFEYVREDYRCKSCEDEFVATRITSCPPAYVWSARNVLAKLHTAGGRNRSKRAIPLSWYGHPELADFSAVLPAAPPLH